MTLLLTGCQENLLIANMINNNTDLTVNTLTTTNWSIIGGNLYIGGDIVSVDGINATGNIVPALNNTYNIGNSSNLWSNGFFNNITTNILRVNGTSNNTGNLIVGGILTTPNIAGGTSATTGTIQVATLRADYYVKNSATSWNAVNDVNGGIFAFKNNSVTYMLINSTTGNIGIGTTTPTNKLSLSFNAPTSDGLYITNTNSSVVGIMLAYGTTGSNNNLQVGTTSNHDMLLETNNNARIMIKNNGNIGIGTTNPSVTLNVVATQTGVAGTQYMGIINSCTGNPSGNATANTAYYCQNNLQQFSANYDARNISLAGQWNKATITATNNTLNAGYGIINEVRALGATGNTQNITTWFGQNQQITLDSNFIGTVSSMGGIINSFNVQNESAKVTNGYHLLFNTPTLTGNVTNMYGAYINAQTVTGKTTNAYAIYQAGKNDTNYFGGNVGIGTTIPSVKLEVNSTTIALYASDNSSRRMCLNITQSGVVSGYAC